MHFVSSYLCAKNYLIYVAVCGTLFFGGMHVIVNHKFRTECMQNIARQHYLMAAGVENDHVQWILV